MKKKQKQSKNPKRQYFTEKHEQAILDYVAEEDQREREKIYVTMIQPVFREMIEKIVFTYRFISLPNIDILKQECQADLISILSKYKPKKGSAFSYFSVVTKNWFNHKRKKCQSKAEISLEDSQVSSSTKKITNHIDLENNYEEQQFWKFLREEINTWDNTELKISDNEKKVVEAIKTLMDDINNLDIITRKSVYLYLREITGLPTKKIVAVLVQLRKKYFFFKRRWLNEIY